ncbi:MAG: hypothetical protein ACYCT1_08340 [Steroidobacteraceae bacterium]
MARPRTVTDDPKKAAELAAARDRMNKHNAEKRAAGTPPGKKGARRNPQLGKPGAVVMPSSPVTVQAAYLLGRTAAWIRVRLGRDVLLDDDEARAILAQNPLGELMVRSDMTIVGLRDDYEEWKSGGTVSTSG